ncbi:unnamed protein product, partial [Mesorhabditis belari]|uniref:MPN domain-containing protein n=1 Tax=Mesorhabditis belari TaxID=2138241 RepID=A0AAF3EGF6_9BILA
MLGKSHGGKLTITSVVPLVHESAPLSPSIEIALALVSSKDDQSIVGIYYSNASYQDKSFNPYSIRLAEKIAAVTGQSTYLAQVVNWHLTADCSSPCISVYQQQDSGSWKDIKVDVDPVALTLVSSALQKKLYRELVDFENHLDNPELDFYNSSLNRMLREEL